MLSQGLGDKAPEGAPPMVKESERFFCNENIAMETEYVFLGYRTGLYLEDLYVSPECRGNGYGKAILKKLATIAVERKCGRLEWWCLDFYLSLGAEPVSDWTVYRITGETLNKLAK